MSIHRNPLRRSTWLYWLTQGHWVSTHREKHDLTSLLWICSKRIYTPSKTTHPSIPVRLQSTINHAEESLLMRIQGKNNATYVCQSLSCNLCPLVRLSVLSVASTSNRCQLPPNSTSCLSLIVKTTTTTRIGYNDDDNKHNNNDNVNNNNSKETAT